MSHNQNQSKPKIRKNENELGSDQNIIMYLFGEIVKHGSQHIVKYFITYLQ